MTGDQSCEQVHSRGVEYEELEQGIPRAWRGAISQEWDSVEDKGWPVLERAEAREEAPRGGARNLAPRGGGAEPGTVYGARSSQVSIRPSECFLFFSFVYPFNKYILSNCCVPGTILCAEIQRGEHNELLGSLRSRRVG